MLKFSRKLFLKKFRAHCHEASDKCCPEMNPDSEVPMLFLELKSCKTYHYTIWGKSQGLGSEEEEEVFLRIKKVIPKKSPNQS